MGLKLPFLTAGREKEKARIARRARDEAQECFDAAVARGDTRGMHAARQRLKAATLECLRVGA